MSTRWQYFPRYDVSVNIDTGEVHLPICKCGEEDMCIFKSNWVEDGSPTHISGEELEYLRKRYDEDESHLNTEI